MAQSSPSPLPQQPRLQQQPMSVQPSLAPPKAPQPRLVIGERGLGRIMLGTCACCLTLIGLALAWLHSQNLPLITTFADYQPAQAALILDRRAEPLAMLTRERRLPVDSHALPALLPRAFVAAEDAQFWKRPGADAWSILRVGLHNAAADRRGQGGFTITRQVARALMPDRKQTFGRPFLEAFLAWRLDKTLAKEEILAIYLNEVPLGEGAYGVEAAARAYFGKPAAELDLAEIALLAGLAQAPDAASPIKNFQAAKSRQRAVLNRMVEDRIISAEESQAAFNQELAPVQVNPCQDALHGWLARYLRQELEQNYSAEILDRGGLQVRTSVDGRLQEAALRALTEGVHRVARRQPEQPAPQAALVALDTAGGRILALIGGTDCATDKFNRATQAKRPPGSAFKPILYGAALEQGRAGNSRIADSPLSLENASGTVWTPKNFGNKYRGEISLEEALVVSSNVAAVRLLQETGFPAVAETSRRLGITAALNTEHSLALGASPVSLLELTGAYTAFPGEGSLHAPCAITSVRTRDGRIHPWPQPPLQKALSPETARWLHLAMIQAVRRGTGRQAAGIENASGKTGTTDNNADAWFVGSAAGLTVGVWVGHDRGGPLGPGEGGGATAAPIWRDFMEEAVEVMQE